MVQVNFIFWRRILYIFYNVNAFLHYSTLFFCACLRGYYTIFFILISSLRHGFVIITPFHRLVPLKIDMCHVIAG